MSIIETSRLVDILTITLEFSNILLVYLYLEFRIFVKLDGYESMRAGAINGFGSPTEASIPIYFYQQNKKKNI